MDAKRRNKIMFRVVLLSMVLVAVFWGIWNIVAGSVPVTTELGMTSEWTYQLPFSISRWWDIPAIGVLSIILVIILTRINWEDESLFGALSVFIVAGISFGIVAGIGGAGIGAGLGVVIFSGIGFGIVAGRGVGISLGVVVSISFGLGAGIGDVGIVAGIVVSLGVIIVAGLGVGIAAVIWRSIKYFFSPKIWKRFSKWLIGLPEN